MRMRLLLRNLVYFLNIASEKQALGWLIQGNCGSLLDLEATYYDHRRVNNKGSVDQWCPSGRGGPP